MLVLRAQREAAEEWSGGGGGVGEWARLKAKELVWVWPRKQAWASRQLQSGPWSVPGGKRALPL